MNRRKKKQQQVDYVALIQERVKQVDWKKASLELKSLWLSLPKLHQRALMVLVPLVMILLVLPTPKSDVEPSIKPNQRVEIDINTQGLSEQKSQATVTAPIESWSEYTVKSGDTLAQVFRANGLPMADLNALVKVEGTDKPLSRIKKGQLVRFKLASDGKLDILQLEKNSGSVMFFRLSDGGFGRSK
ncbi:lysine transporter LysM [Vibrio sp. SCSIO 43135]|uniref:Lysine transporter LysM n=1 Tax=Vibrio paucivorans TaxID=2829489 RepID=A0A9X3HS25_9VIBR|nr:MULTISPECIES: LysM-like peptidoglycan-binding domain-containing protein [Vibrio]MCW8334615.1 lysine transporter LysM [Vibrio paucivorans]USD41427.1 lysine transporter LysM [Vibrio sp. SCSIO 43135]